VKGVINCAGGSTLLSFVQDIRAKMTPINNIPLTEFLFPELVSITISLPCDERIFAYILIIFGSVVARRNAFPFWYKFKNK
jgi:hypothetical protein